MGLGVRIRSLNERNIEKEKIRISYFYLYFSILEKKKILGKYAIVAAILYITILFVIYAFIARIKMTDLT
ncbi:hypothetical protein NQ317_018021 [Molorchus minor]|uniref:Uncharacterized protein n=1 Tax=Molorchus minor TaxID=1323400 RepID=A0ABQ9JS01_9CUCU|nr:hypothetical protein NQ317_018021 [Molorchus minor]